MADRILGIGNKIELRELQRKNPDEAAVVYVSQILDFSEEAEDVLMAAMPIYEGHLVPLEIGRRYEACFSTAKGLYKAECTVINRAKNENIYYMEMLLNTRLKKFQRREHFRLSCSLEVQYQVLTEEERRAYVVTQEIQEEYSGPVKTGTAIDISGGGLRILCSGDYARNDYILLHLQLNRKKDDTIKMQLMGNVISTAKARSGAGQNDIRVQFLIQNKEQQEKIIKYIFEEQRRQMQKERGTH